MRNRYLPSHEGISLKGNSQLKRENSNFRFEKPGRHYLNQWRKLTPSHTVRKCCAVLVRARHPSCGILYENRQTQSNDENIPDKLKFKNTLQNNWLAFFSILMLKSWVRGQRWRRPEDKTLVKLREGREARGKPGEYYKFWEVQSIPPKLWRGLEGWEMRKFYFIWWLAVGSDFWERSFIWMPRGWVFSFLKAIIY